MTSREIREITAKVLKNDVKDIIVMTPTIKRAVYEWKTVLSRWSPIIKRTNKASLYIELLNGRKIYFKAETQGRHAFLGYNAYIISVDEFVGSEDKEVENGNYN